MKKVEIKKSIVPYILLFLVIISIMYLAGEASKVVHKLTYDEFMGEVTKGTIEEITIIPKKPASIYEVKGTLKKYKKEESFISEIPYSEEVVSRLLKGKDNNEFKMVIKADPSSSSLVTILVNVLPIVLLLGLTFLVINRQMGGANKSFDFGKSQAKLQEEKGKINFNNVAGLQEEKEEVKELIDFLKNPKKFQRLGARIPKGVLLVGPPGTGKTLLAKAVAGEANVPFYFISGSEFVELFVGVGASRVRDMFKQAKMNAPCLIFIDEIDAVGRQRGTGLGGGHDEREQTLNQLLTEMDGFGSNEGIIIIAATNRPDVLDPALLRPGRFDRQIMVNLPNVEGREEILSVHAKGKIFAPNIKLYNIAKRTVGFSGADLENLLNEAALLAVRRDKNAITMSEIDEAHDRVLMGPAKVSHKYLEREKRIIAYHEAGHAVMGIKLDGANQVQKITIIPRGRAGGYNLMMPKEETFLSTKKELLETISGLLGGRVSEEIVFNEMTTGAHNDFEKATKIARAMVTEYGMSSLGPVQFEHPDSSIFLGRDYTKSKNFSSQVAFQIDEEIRKIISQQYEITKKIIGENIKLLDLIANNLLKYETLTKEQIDCLVEHGEMQTEGKELTLKELKEKAKEKGLKGYSKMNKEELLKKL